jgi:hypothetical protein
MVQEENGKGKTLLEEASNSSASAASLATEN